MVVQVMQPVPMPKPFTLPDILQTGLGLGTQIQQFRALPEDIKQQQALKEAQIAREQQLAQAAAAGEPERYAPGAAGIVQGLEMIRQKYGEDSQQYQQAQRLAETATNYQTQRGNYYNAHLALKNFTPIMKDQLALQLQRETGRPLSEIKFELEGGNPPQPISISPEGAYPGNTNTIHNPESQAGAIANTPFPTDKEKQEVQEQMRQTEADITKKIGSAKARAALPPLLDIAQTMNRIDFSPISQYAGVTGKSQATINRVAAMLNLPTPPEFQKYNLFVTTQVPLIADSIRQALQTSIRNEYVRSMILPLADPLKWTQNPQFAMQRFTWFRQWLNDRLKMFSYLAAKGIPVNTDEMDKVLGIGEPSDTQKQQAPVSTMMKKSTTTTETLYSTRLGRNVTLDEINETAKNRGESVDEVKRKLGIG